MQGGGDGGTSVSYAKRNGRGGERLRSFASMEGVSVGRSPKMDDRVSKNGRPRKKTWALMTWGGAFIDGGDANANRKRVGGGKQGGGGKRLPPSTWASQGSFGAEK